MTLRAYRRCTVILKLPTKLTHPIPVGEMAALSVTNRRVLLAVCSTFLLVSCGDITQSAAPEAPVKRTGWRDCWYKHFGTTEQTLLGCSNWVFDSPMPYTSSTYIGGGGGTEEITTYYCTATDCPLVPEVDSDYGEDGTGSPGTNGTEPTLAPVEVVDIYPSFACLGTPAECFTSVQMAQNAAVVAAMMEARRLTAATGDEYGAWIRRRTDGSLFISEILKGARGPALCKGADFCMPQMRPSDKPLDAVGMFHTHPMYPLPSGADQQAARAAMIYSYIVSSSMIVALNTTGNVIWQNSR